MVLWVLFAVLAAAVVWAVTRPLLAAAEAGPGTDSELAVYRDQLAEIEAEEGALATYFVNPHCTFYNLLEPEISALVRRIRDLGHVVLDVHVAQLIALQGRHAAEMGLDEQGQACSGRWSDCGHSVHSSAL